MSDNQNTNTDQQASGSTDQQNTSGDNQQKKPDGTVAYETYQKVLNEAKNAKEKLRALESEFHKERENKMKHEGDWKGLIELREKEIKELKDQMTKISNDYSTLDSHVKTSKKLSAVLNKIEGVIDQKYYGLIDLDEVMVNPESGEIDEMSVIKAAQSFKTQYPEVVRKSGFSGMMGDGRTNNSSSTEGATIGRDAWIKLPYRDKMKWKHAQIIG